MTLDKLRKLKSLRAEKIELHESWYKCKQDGDQIGMQRYKNKIKKIDKEILKVMDGK